MINKRNVFALCNQKGGVGKTTTVINIGTCLAQMGLKILVVDVDPQGNATSGFGVDKISLKLTSYDNVINKMPFSDTVIKEVIPNIDIIPANAHLAGAEIELIHIEDREFSLRKLLRQAAEDYNFVIIDCPPSLGLLTVNAMTAADRLLIPLQCEYYALEGLGQLLDTFNLVKQRLNQGLELFGVILTMADFRTNLTDQVIREVKDFFKEKVFTAIIPRSIKLSEAPGFGKPGVIYAPYARGSFQYQLLAEELLQKLNIPTEERKEQITSSEKSEAAKEIEYSDDENRESEVLSDKTEEER